MNWFISNTNRLIRKGIDERILWMNYSPYAWPIRWNPWWSFCFLVTITMFIQWDIVLVPFPFSDLTGKKQRPALVVSSDMYNTWCNVMLIGIYGNAWLPLYTYPLTPQDLSTGIMNKPSFIRYQNIFSIHTGLIIKTIGKVTPKTLHTIIQSMHSFL